MYPIIYADEYLVITSWHLCYLIGSLVAYAIITSSIWEPLLTHNHRHRLACAIYLGCYFGARFYSIIFEQTELLDASDKLTALLSLGPMTYYGGFILASLLAFIYIKSFKLDWRPCLDIFLPACMIASGIGRIGCFLNGDDYGIIVSSTYADAWWAVSFPNHTPSYPRVPVQVIEAFILCFISSYLLFRRVKIAKTFGIGALGVLSLCSYCLTRFTLEYLRGDPRGFWIEGQLSSAQGLSIVFFAVGLVLWPLVIGKPTKTTTNHS